MNRDFEYRGTSFTTAGRQASVVCKYCCSTRVRKYGLVEGVQRYFCNDCRRKFSPNNCLFRMKTPAESIAPVLEMYYRGSTIEQIRRYFSLEYGSSPSSKTIYAWLVKYSSAAVQQFAPFRPAVGENWIADTAPIRVNGVAGWRLDILDGRSGFVLASRLESGLTPLPLTKTLEQARSTAGASPAAILVASGAGFPANGLAALSLEIGLAVRRYRSLPDPSSGAEAARRALRQFDPILARCKNPTSAGLFLAGHRVYYNFLSSAGEADQPTPAERSGSAYFTRSWLEIIRAHDPGIRSLVEPLPGTPRVVSRRSTEVGRRSGRRSGRNSGGRSGRQPQSRRPD